MADYSGGADSDLLNGSDAADVIVGNGGDDTLNGAGGNDTIFGGTGNDSLSGGDGDDAIYLGSGTDLAFGGSGNDVFHVDAGAVGGSVDGGEAPGDYDILDLSAWGHPRTNIIYNSDATDSGIVQFLDGNGIVQSTMSFSNIEKVVACFTPGTLILTIEGETPVEDLCLGDLVLTRDNGYQPIRWIGRRDLPPEALLANPKLNPVRIKTDAIAAGMPSRDLLVSPQHRMLLSDPGAELLFGESEVLIAAAHLLNRRGVQRTRPNGISYFHFMFDQHEIVLSNGAWSESFQPGLQTLGDLDAEQRAEILALFPELLSPEGYAAARLTLKAREVKIIFENQ